MLDGGALTIIGIIAGVIVSIFLFIWSIKNSYVSAIISTLIAIAVLVCAIIFRERIVEAIELCRTGISNENSNFGDFFTFAAIYAIPVVVWFIYYGGEACFESTIETYLILGTLVEQSTSGFKTFIICIVGGYVLGMIAAALIVWVGGFLIYLVPSILILISGIRLVRVFID